MNKTPEFRLSSGRLTAVAAVLATLVLLAGCAASRPAPVSDARPPLPRSEPAGATKPADASAQEGKSAEALRLHVVQRGETLYSIAFQNGIDIRELAAWNNIVNPAVIRAGDTLRLTSPDAPVAAAPDTPQPGVPVATPLIFTPAVVPGTPGSSLVGAPPAQPAVAAPPLNAQNTDSMKVEPKAGRVPYTDAAYAKLSAEAAATGGPLPSPAISATVSGNAVAPASSVASAGSDAIAWSWPVKGKLLSNFTESSKGIDIAGSKGAPVFAAAPGKVIHSGSVIRGYGRLIIIKHSDTWLSAYAHNEKLLVNEGDDIRKGQKIAEMGSSDTDAVKLHFEIRSKGKPVDPIKFLPPQ